jgi:hypothetical protein
MTKNVAIVGGNVEMTTVWISAFLFPSAVNFLSVSEKFTRHASRSLKGV